MNRSPQVVQASYMGRLHDPVIAGANFCTLANHRQSLANTGGNLQTSAAVTLQASDVVVQICGSALGAFPGSECVGVVAEAGAAAQHLAGQSVLVPRILPCGECSCCRRGAVLTCPQRRSRPSTPQSYEVLPARYLLPLQPPFVDAAPLSDSLWQFAALADALLTPYAGLVRAGVSPGTVCVVLGLGVRSALTAVLAEALGLFVVRFSAEDAARLDPAGARQRVAELATAQGLPLAGACIIETIGSDAARARAILMAEPASTVLLLERSQPLGGTIGGLVGEPQGGAQLVSLATLEHVVAMQAQVVAVAPHPDLLPELLALCTRTRLDLAQHTRAVAVEEAEAVMEARRCGQESDQRLPIVVFPPP